MQGEAGSRGRGKRDKGREQGERERRRSGWDQVRGAGVTLGGWGQGVRVVAGLSGERVLVGVTAGQGSGVLAASCGMDFRKWWLAVL